ncbi:tyrosine--tRNA ligase [Candidatus Nomurabacteria bacterium]|nr:tyrosine--tRNA ligase [Candidatus Nomurabacteria bacterium]
MFGFNTKVSTNKDKINYILSRGVENIYPSKDFLEKLLSSGKRLKIYLGVDPTGPSLHLGHAVAIRKLRKLQDLGHEIILLIGDFTAMIGDPDKLAVRKQLTRKEVLNNCKNYKKQVGKILSFSGSNKARFVFNSKWLANMNFADVLNLASKITVDQMLKREMFQLRMKEGRPVYIHEFMYPLMQGYDSVVMGVDGEIGGNDQTFNMLMGRELMKEMKNKEKFVIAMKLLVDPTGKKMGKTEGNMISLTDSPYEMFGKVMSWTDQMIISGFEICTDVSGEEISKIDQDIKAGSNPRDAKIRLAKEIITMFFDKSSAEKAEQNFIKTFSKGGLPEDIQKIQSKVGDKLADVLVKEKVVSSKSDFRRLVLEGAISETKSEKKIEDPNFSMKESVTLKIGKRRFVEVEVV